MAVVSFSIRLAAITLLAGCAHPDINVPWDLGIPRSAPELRTTADKDREFQKHAIASWDSGLVTPYQPFTPLRRYARESFLPVLSETSPTARAIYERRAWTEIPAAASLLGGSALLGYGVTTAVLSRGGQPQAAWSITAALALFVGASWLSKERWDDLEAARVRYNQDLATRVYGEPPTSSGSATLLLPWTKSLQP